VLAVISIEVPPVGRPARLGGYPDPRRLSGGLRLTVTRYLLSGKV
jgi:hypothetical protein